MLVISLIVLILKTSFQYNHSLYSFLFLRIGWLLFVLTGALSLNAFYIQSIGSGMGIYSGLFSVTNVTQFFDFFISLMAAFILLS